MRSRPWDIIHVQGIHTMVLPFALAAARRHHIPYVVTLHSGGHSSGFRRRARVVVWHALRRWLREAKWIIAVSQFERDTFRALLAIPEQMVTVIPSGVELPAPQEESSRGNSEREPLIASVGRLERYKGHDRALEALPIVAAEFPGVGLAILGTGPDEPRLRQLAARLDVEERVEFVSFPPARRAELHTLLDRADLVVALSAYESQGLAAMEAVGRGCSVLVAESTALKELVEAGLARGINLGPPEDLAAAIVRQLRHPHRPSQGLPTWDECTARTLALYRASVSQPSVAPGGLTP